MRAMTVAATTGAFTIVPRHIDLSATFSNVPVSLAVGKRGNVTLRITNQGTVAAVGVLQLILSASPNGVLESSSTEILRLSRRINIRPDGSLAMRLSRLQFPQSPGSYFVIAELDPNRMFHDINQANNAVMSTTAVVVS